MRLRIELVPSTAWWSNVRSQVTRSQWQKCKKFVGERSGYKCEICGGKGRKHPIECHELWQYDDENQIQTLVGLIALCPDCHRCIHMGRTMSVSSQLEIYRLKLHMMTVNGWPVSRQVDEAYDNALAIWSIRSSWQWGLDVSYLQELGIRLPRYTWEPAERVTA